jgi:prepilin-type N-terminal cleavage/methylation domain-containing protein
MKRGEHTVKNEKGFTLVELMIVVIIIGILTAVGVPLYMGYVRSAKVASAQAVIGTIVNAEKLYNQKNGTFVDVADFTPATNALNIDVRDATQYWTVVVSGSTASKFTITATGVAATEYAGLVVKLDYDAAANEVWTFTEGGTAFTP